MKFKEWQKTAVYTSAPEHANLDEDVMALIYEGGCYILRVDELNKVTGDRLAWHLPLERESFTSNYLRELEEMLYTWLVEEGYFAQATYSTKLSAEMVELFDKKKYHIVMNGDKVELYDDFLSNRGPLRSVPVVSSDKLSKCLHMALLLNSVNEE